MVKGEGGAVGLTSNFNALKRWMIAGPEISTLIKTFEAQLFTSPQPDSSHHDEHPSVQTKFLKEIRVVVSAFHEAGNPFSEDSGYLIALDTKNIMPDAVVDAVRNIVSTGQSQYDAFIQERFLDRSKAVRDPIKKNQLPSFSRPGKIGKGSSNTTIAVLKSDCALFARMYIACQARDGDLENFFKHENQPYPPSLAKLGEMRSGKKADLLICFSSLPQPAAASTPATSTSSTAAEGFHIQMEADELGTDPELPIPDDLLDVTDFLQDEMDLDTLLTELDFGAATEILEVSTVEGSPVVDAKVLDGAAIVQMLPPKLSKTFLEYTRTVFEPYILRQLETVSRLDVVWDVYLPDSLKTATREKRGSGVRKRVSSLAVIPRNWQGFLRVDKNKEELFAFLSNRITTLDVPAGKTIVSTHHDRVLTSSTQFNTDLLEPCCQEEADSRILLHVQDCAKKGIDRVMIRTTDTDVVVLAIANMYTIPVSEIWVAFGVGKNFRYIPAHLIATQLGERRSRALPFFHAMTGCDTVSFFAGKGKKTAWEVWRAFPEITDIFCSLSAGPETVLEDWMNKLQRFVVLLHDKTSTVWFVNQARQTLFAQQSRSLESIPPTAHALKQHILRATYQAGHVWGKCLKRNPKMPDPAGWGWQRESSGKKLWVPLWTTLPQASESCYELIKCGCRPEKGGCRSYCRCKKASLCCTALCLCSGDC